MAFNSFGRLFKMTSYGESHGPVIGCVLDGIPPGLALDEAYIQPFLDARKPGQNRFTSQRREPDTVQILSGVYEGRTTGAPIHLQIENQDQRSKDYSEIADRWRPGHADYTYDMKYGFRDPRGGGRSSARETACRVMAGAVARRLLGDEIKIQAYMIQLGPHKIDRSRFDAREITKNPFFCPDPVAAKAWADILDNYRKAGNSIGGVVEIVASGVPAGWGAPVYAKLDSDLASAMMTINAVKAVEIGAGFEAASLTGSENADEIYKDANGNIAFSSNHAGGILGGISSGQDIICRFAVKPTSSILIPKQSLTQKGEAVQIITKGRHDPCVAIRAVPVGEAMTALVLGDHKLLHRAQCG